MEISCTNPNCSSFSLKDPIYFTKNGYDKKGNQRYICKTCRTTFIPAILNTTQSFSTKQSQAGVKSMRGRPEYYDELKGKVTLALTPTAEKALEVMSAEYKLSKSEVVERFCRGANFQHPAKETLGVSIFDLEKDPHLGSDLEHEAGLLLMVIDQVGTWALSNGVSSQARVQPETLLEQSNRLHNNLLAFGKTESLVDDALIVRTVKALSELEAHIKSISIQTSPSQ